MNSLASLHMASAGPTNISARPKFWGTGLYPIAGLESITNHESFTYVIPRYPKGEGARHGLAGTLTLVQGLLYLPTLRIKV